MKIQNTDRLDKIVLCSHQDCREHLLEGEVVAELPNGFYHYNHISLYRFLGEGNGKYVCVHYLNSTVKRKAEWLISQSEK